MTNSLSGLTALVTGSTSGIGRAVAERLAGLGAHVIVSGRDETRGNAITTRIRDAGGTADFVAADLGSDEGIKDLGDAALRVTGTVDILVNNAGTFPFVPTVDTTPELADRVLALNIKAPLLLTGRLVGPMIERGAGSIINIGSVVADRGIPGATAYSASKAALHELSRVWVAEFGSTGVRVNTVMPGMTETEGIAAATGDAERAAFLSLTPAGRVGTPEEVADAVAFVASDDARYIHGAFIPVDGGLAAL